MFCQTSWVSVRPDSPAPPVPGSTSLAAPGQGGRSDGDTERGLWLWDSESVVSSLLNQSSRREYPGTRTRPQSRLCLRKPRWYLADSGFRRRAAPSLASGPEAAQGPGFSTPGPQRLHVSEASRAALRSHESLQLGTTESLGLEQAVDEGFRCPGRAALGRSLRHHLSLPRGRPIPQLPAQALRSPPLLSGPRPPSAALQKPRSRSLFRLCYPPGAPPSLDALRSPHSSRQLEKTFFFFFQMQNNSSLLNPFLKLFQKASSARVLRSCFRLSDPTGRRVREASGYRRLRFPLFWLPWRNHEFPELWSRDRSGEATP